jgi:hypothetical protein
MNAKATICVFALLALCVITIPLLFYGGPQTYFGMLHHDKGYYARIAESCRNLLSQTNYLSKEYTINGDDPSLPTALLKLHATTIRVANHVKMGNPEIGTNDYVSIIFGEGRPYYTISWCQNVYGDGHRPWELTVNGDGPYTIVWSSDDQKGNK